MPIHIQQKSITKTLDIRFSKQFFVVSHNMEGVSQKYWFLVFSKKNIFA